MDARTLVAGDYIDAAMLKGRKVTREISHFETKLLEDMKKETKTRGIISFKGADKKWVTNVTAIKCLMKMFGHETDDWIGRRITLHAEKEPKSESGEAVRLWGSPDLDEDMTFTVKIGRTNRTFTMHAVKAPKRDRTPGEDDD